ncbi:sigma-70 family RNA polymerase sigma factor [Streptomyces sp. NPDC020681]|uniref:sigma-70 family RNA polymerase sigma factor n=1 Tax=Streptomyces sp. NPDC020681 TaxID=3365083 RepID=UPI00378A21D1
MATALLTRPETSRPHEMPAQRRPELRTPPATEPKPPTPNPPRTATAAQLEQIEALHGASLLRYCMSLTRGNWMRAEEIKQETLIRAWKNPHAMTSREFETFRPWLFTVARRISIDLERARRARPQECDQEVLRLIPEADCGYERVHDIEMVRAAIRALPRQQREVIVCLHFKSMTSAEAAEALGIPQGTVKSRAYYALKSLQRTLVARGFND